MNHMDHKQNIVVRALRKFYYQFIGANPLVDRFFRYRRPREYWQKRGGEQYFDEQEAAQDRTRRSEFIAGEIHKLQLRSLLEVGCGYGKQLRNLASKDIFLVGCDFSAPQLRKAKEFCDDCQVCLVEADAEKLPFRDKSLNAVFSSAVILHNDYDKAKKMIAEMIRVSQKYLIHNEDTDVTFSRYGYDLRKTYEKMNLTIIDSKHIPCSPDPTITQFTIAELPHGNYRVNPIDVPLQYFEKKSVL